MIDAAYQVFVVIYRETLAIQVQRFGAAVVQVLPLLSTKLGGSLALTLQLYSLSFALYPLLIFGLLVWPVRNYRMALALVLFFALMQTHTFYWIQSELIQGCMFTFLFLGIASRRPNASWWGTLGLVVLLILVIYAHPLAIFALVFGWVFLSFDRTFRQGRLSIVIPIATVVIMLVKHVIYPIGGYDQTAMQMVDGFWERFPRIFELPGTHFFYNQVIRTYYLFLIALAGLIVFYVAKRSWGKLLWMLGAILVWLILILTTYHWTPERFYIESYYLMLGLLTGIPLAWDVFPGLERPRLVAALVLVICFMRVVQIIQGSELYQNRLGWIKEQVEIMEKEPQQRFLMRESQVPMYWVHMYWAMPFETMLLTSLTDDSPSKMLLVVGNDQDVTSFIETRDAMPTLFGPYSYDDINGGPYFDLQDTLPVRILGPH